MVQTGTPEQYFGYVQPIATPQPIEAKVVEPVEVKYARAQIDNTPLILAICFLGAVSIGLVILLGLHIFVRGK